MSDSDSEDDGAEAFIQTRSMVRRNAKQFSTDIDSSEEYRQLEPLFNNVYHGAAQLRVVCIGRRDTYEGQMGMVDFGDGVAQPVTCLHNVVARLGSEPKYITCTFDGRSFNETFEVHIQHMGIPVNRVQPLMVTIDDQTIFWQYGVDITKGEFPEDEPTPQSRHFHVFQAESVDFEYPEGTKVAMAVFAKHAATEDSSRMPPDVAATVTPTQVYGAADEINIYTGKITRRHERHFEHDMNSYRGCSGAIIFLLEGPHAGYAIGVHIGSPLQLPHTVNLAVKIRESPTLVQG
mmetsp:Transcript_14219/g.39425  ORF Transcript_14219/g.39425 Transcript_14219/m.39425 type:complete len:291 (+) Transcript_14219:111-983(+)|eukprot:CAMPEP_0168771856 /NCGR_PEP_ID=MMETSP0725-20121227/3654_1 /TAXON_ID=265536 /ORGANISM="Amphiprora sp., Strain CCMP467" /LENGTH=290 /DNA_ID=CAMNT_0008821351 /DNA_START=46 /DNA_END=918 /DNA_ORIENTATION=+